MIVNKSLRRDANRVPSDKLRALGTAVYLGELKTDLLEWAYSGRVL